MNQRKHPRYKIKEDKNIKTKIQLHEKAEFIECNLVDISLGGACIQLNKENFIQIGKFYPIQIQEFDTEGNLIYTIEASGKQSWYLIKDNTSLYIGLSFDKEIELKESLIN